MLLEKILPAIAGDTTDTGSIPGSGIYPGISGLRQAGGWGWRLRKLIFEHTKHLARLFEEQGEDSWTVLAVSCTNNHRARSTPGSSSTIFILDCLGQKEKG